MENHKQNMTEQRFLRILTSSVCGIVLCLAGLVSTTWAWYSIQIECTNNVIQVGRFGAEVTLCAMTDGEVLSVEGIYLLEPGDYLVELRGSPDNTSPGFCSVLVDGQEAGQSAAIYPEDDGLRFVLSLSGSAEVELVSVMGMPSAAAPVGDGDTLRVTVGE